MRPQQAIDKMFRDYTDRTVRDAKKSARDAIETINNVTREYRNGVSQVTNVARRGSVAGTNNVVVGGGRGGMAGIFAGGKTLVGRYEIEPGTKYSSLRSENGACYLDEKKCGLKTINGRQYWSLDVPPSSSRSSRDNVVTNVFSGDDSSESDDSSSSSSSTSSSEVPRRKRARGQKSRTATTDLQRAIAESVEIAAIQRIPDIVPSSNDLVGMPEKTNVDKDACVVCSDNKKDVVFLPCGHVCTCVVCARKLLDGIASKKLCPNCRTAITVAKRVYF